jgi:hypothetical protein
MNCPYCKQILPENHAAGICPYCGHNLPSANPGPTTTAGPKPGWLWFWAALLGPPVLTLLSALLMKQAAPSHASNESLSPAVALLGGGAGGIVCGIILGVRLGKNPGARVALALLLAFIMVPVCIMTCFFGCSLGGYQMDFK